MMRISVFILLGGIQAALAADYCSLIVRVLSPDNRRPLETLVSVLEESGRVSRKETGSKDIRFCDLGISPVTVTVGGDECNQVVVHNVPLTWGEEYLLTITFDPEPCQQERLPMPVCDLLFRIADSGGKWLEKASIVFDGQRFPRAETDTAGRILVVPRIGERVTGTVTASGYLSRTFAVSCSGALWKQETILNLKRLRGR